MGIKITYDHGAVAAVSKDVITTAAGLQEVGAEFQRQRARLDPEFDGTGARAYYDRQAQSERALAKISEGMAHLGQAISMALGGAQDTDAAGASFFG